MRKLLLATSALFILSACDLSPDFTLPDVFSSDNFKENAAPVAAQTDAAKTDDKTVATEAQPAVASTDDIKWKRVDDKAKIEEFAWWRMFNTPELDALEEQALKDNPSLESARQRVESARAQAQIEESSLWPTISAGFGPRRQQPAAADVNANIPPGFNVQPKPYTTYTAQGSITYELDLFGKNRNTARAAALDAQAMANDYRAARLALQSDIAQAYFQRASLTMELDILNRTIKARTESRALTLKKRDVGEVDDLELSTQDTDLANAQSDRDVVAQQLSINEHTLAILVGVPPAEFKGTVAKITALPPAISAGLPSALLERRPDIQSAAKSIAAANARIGAARAGYFPDISLSGVFGYESTELGKLFKAGNKTWAIGPLTGGTILTQPLFEGGLLSGTLDARHADYAAASANYKTSVLQAFREVEDGLSNLQHLREQAANRQTSVRASKRAYDVAKQRYDVGYSSNLEFLDAERSLLAAQRSEVQVLGQRYIETIQLVKALGGSWQTPPATSAGTSKEAPAAPTVAAPFKAETKEAPAVVTRTATPVEKTPATASTPVAPAETSASAPVSTEAASKAESEEPGFFERIGSWFDSGESAATVAPTTQTPAN